MPILRSDPSAFEGDEVIIEPPFEVLKEMFKYKIRPTLTHKEILKMIEVYVTENEKFMKRKNLKAARRARTALLNLFHLSRIRRTEISSICYDKDFRDDEFIV